jgi:hypothetical protein
MLLAIHSPLIGTLGFLFPTYTIIDFSFFFLIFGIECAEPAFEFVFEHAVSTFLNVIFLSFLT